MEKIQKNKKRKIVYDIIVILLILILLLIGWNKLQDYIFFHPWNDIYSYEQLLKISNFEGVNIKSDGKILN